MDTPKTDVQERNGWRKMQKAVASQSRKDGVGACDALYELAVKLGASETEAAGFAHHINGALALLETQVHDGLVREKQLDEANLSAKALEQALIQGRAEVYNNEVHVLATFGWLERRAAKLRAMASDLSGYIISASQVRRGYDVECEHCGKFCDEGPGPCQPEKQSSDWQDDYAAMDAAWPNAVGFIEHFPEQLSKMEMTVHGIGLGVGKHPLYAAPSEASLELARAKVKIAALELQLSLSDDSGKESIRERDMLAEAICNAAVKSGIYREGISMTGPQLLMACDDMAECIKSAENNNS